MSVSRLNRSQQTPPVAPVRYPARERNQNAREDAASLTDRDRELIFQATGQRIRAGETNQGWINSLAAAIAADRASGRLAPGQEITALYLKDLARRYDQNPTGRNPVNGYLEPALRYLSQHGGGGSGGGRLDVSA
ncbi:hypothetical protein OHA21_24265 [Actinoplanes sp. NBC_00393]|uniref:hypothetical protein n=1 Tax=Actinoplanes sp. NBC_00393 TaxID=2975953 RepID=UPI002E1A1F5B